MIGISPDATNDQHIAYNPSFLEADNNPEKPAQAIGHPLAFPHGIALEDSSSEEGLQGHASLELIASTSQKEGSIGLLEFLLMLWNATPHHTYIDAASDPLNVVKIPWASGGVSQLSLWESEPSTTDAGQVPPDLRAAAYPHIRWVLNPSAMVNQWSVDESLQPRFLGVESPTATAHLERADNNAILNEISAELDAVVRWRENWNGEVHDEKPSEEAIDRAKRLAGELLGAVILAGRPCHIPVVTYDYDGYINMVWRNGKYELYLDIREDEIEYTKVWGSNIDSEMDSGVPSKDNYLTLWEWLLDG